MPLFAYFAWVTPVLLALLFVAEAQLGPPKPLEISTAFHGLPKPFKAPPLTPVLTVREAPAPDPDVITASVASAVAGQPIMARATEADAPQPVRKPKPRTVAKKIIKQAPPPPDAFAYAPFRQHGVVW